jgi:hypothetical protein
MPRMRVRADITEARLRSAVEMYEQGNSYQAIATALGYSTASSARNAVRSGILRLNGGSSSVQGRRFGVEIEFSGISRSEAEAALQAAGINAVNEAYNHTTRRHWKLVPDGSVRHEGNGCGELVSPPLRGEAGLAQLELAVATLSAAGATVNLSTGIHVHHDMAGLSGSEIAAFVTLWSERQTAIDSLVSRSRRENRNTYCQNLSDSELRNIVDEFNTTGRIRNSYNRYRKINVMSYPKYGTVEIRQHQGSLDGAKLRHWILFTQALITAAKNHVEANIATDLTGMLADLWQHAGLTEESVNFLTARAEVLAR